MRGRFEWNSWTAEGFRRAVEHFERAIGYDPKYAPAYAGISDSYAAMAYYGFVPPEVGYPRARQAAEQALAIDPDIADAHASLALTYLLWQFDWAAAEREFTTALRLNPQLAVAHATYALFLVTVGRHEEAIQQARMAQQMDPLSLLINMTVCWALHFADRSEEAVRETRRTRELSPGFQEAGNLLMRLYEILGRFEEAARIPLEQPVYGVHMDAAGLLDAYRSGGEEAYLRKRIEILEATRHPGAGRPSTSASRRCTRGLGEADKAPRSPRTAGRRPRQRLGVHRRDPCLRSRCVIPRMQALLTRLGLPRVSAPHTVST